MKKCEKNCENSVYIYIYTIFAVAKLTSMGKSKKSANARHSFNTFPLSLTNEKPKMEGTI